MIIKKTIGSQYTIDLNKQDFYKVGRFIQKNQYDAVEIAGLAEELSVLGYLYNDDNLTQYSNTILEQIKVSEN